VSEGIRFLVIFLATLTGLFSLELVSWVQENLFSHWTAWLAAFSAGLITPFDAGVVAHGNVIWDQKSASSVAIMPGCNGVEACVTLVAAMVAYRAPWKDRLVGIALGCLAVQALNVVRIISLFYLNAWNHEVFEWAHRYVWGGLIMLDVMIVWLFWVRMLQARRAVCCT